VFAKKNFDILPEHHKWDHAIELTPRAEPKSSKVYSLSPLEQAELDTFLEENLHTGQIQPSKSSIIAPVFFIKKKDGSFRLVQDYCAVTNFIQPYLHQFFIDSHGLNSYGKPLKRPFNRYQSRLKAINNGRDIRQINW